ncbi:glycerol-3-phosphate dehydrogenase subunit B [Buttiauxella sp. BIGb0471]|uniref:glycerol-3-phosphate dehydrogenase subunit GlpB n=1 Tax=Buttiauxella sp. BIGb0471 TaxID=2940597 RepID=UPI00216813DA|nr:glycerol-3-phosphate dehydrogenase subunit GlpB [Buttiauxella sp. BIGb0471]MCS3602243.1 glycerol-3-phosphate dehydrogenase subunit B [Buttiauxella sp. BIGb0471]
MKFDSLIIGGGLAGLVCGIRLAEAGLHCAIVSRGQSALHFSSGSLDLLAQLPDGSPVNSPLNALEALKQQAPEHPYSLMGADKVRRYAAESEALLARCSITLTGSYQQNHQRITPLGTQRATWLSPEEIPVAPLAWQRITVVGIAGFLDFQPELVAGSLAENNIEVQVAELTLPALDTLRNNPSEFRAANIARVLDMPEQQRLLIEELKTLANNTDALFLPACLGSENSLAWQNISRQLSCPLHLLPTLPPSVLGMRMSQQLRRRFQQLGGIIMPGDAVVNTEVENRNVRALFTRNHGEVPLRARHIVLASGSFFSNGLQAKFDGIREAIFGLDVRAPTQREDWSKEDFFSPQPYLQAGVTVDEHFHPSRDGQRIENLFAIGSVLAGFDPIEQGCGAGVSMMGALHVARQILEIQGRNQ